MLRPLPFANPTVIAAAGAYLSWRLVRRHRDSVLTAAVLGSYALIVALATGLYTISAWHLPIFQSIQVAGGFWTFAWDASTYHALALKLRNYWVAGGEFPHYDHPDYFVFTALIYLLFGAHPLNAIFLNALFHSAATVGAFTFGQRLHGLPAARLCALLIAFWPSLLLWSSQLLRDTLIVMLVFFLLGSAERGLSGVALAGRLRWAQTRWLVAFSILVFLTFRFRWYVVVFFIVALPIAAVAAKPEYGTGRRGLWYGTLLLIVTLVAAGAGLFVDLQSLLAPAPASTAGASLSESGSSALDWLPLGLRHPLRALNNLRDASSIRARSLIYPDVRFTGVPDVIVFAPSLLAAAFFSPAPSDWFRPNGGTGPFKALGGIETLAMYVLVGPLLIGAVLAVRSRRPGALLLVLYVGISALLAALSIANLGTLFRFRLVFLLPAMVLASAGIDWLRWAFKSSGLARRSAEVLRRHGCSRSGRTPSGTLGHGEGRGQYTRCLS